MGFKPWLLLLLAVGCGACTSTSGLDQGDREAAVALADNAVWASEKVSWQSVSLAGNKVGYRQLTRRTQKGEVLSDELLSVSLAQPGSPVRHSEIRLRYRETEAGRPLAMTKIISADSVDQTQTATVKGAQLRVDFGDGAERLYPLPEDYLMNEGVRRALLQQNGEQRKLRYNSWSFSRQRFQSMVLSAEPFNRQIVEAALGSEALPLLDAGDGDYRWLLRQTREEDKAGETFVVTDSAFFPLAEFHSSGGDLFAAVSCAKDCALAEFSPVTHVYRQLIRSPYRINDLALAGKIRYRLEGDFELAIPSTGEQSVRRRDDGSVEVTVCDDCGDERAPSVQTLETALLANFWLPADHPEIKDVVAEVLPERELSVDARMKRLTRYVTRHMNEVATYAGYANALQALRSGEGDCTEHALLLAALGRAAGVPTRVVLGLAYNNERFLGRRFVFVPHAWVQAWTGERWQSYDSGLGAFTAGYLALGLSNGEQEIILDVNEQLHRLKITSAIQVKSH